jgi:hypothetical protein
MEGVIEALRRAGAAPAIDARRHRHGAAGGPWRGPCTQSESGWATEQLTPHARFGYRAAVLQTQQTPYQKLELLQTPQFGKVLRLDDCFMTSEGEEFFYHEALVHPAAMAHPRRARP